MAAETCRMVLAALSLHALHVVVDGYIHVCLYNSASRHRISAASLSINQINFTLCSHYVYGYATVDANVGSILPMDPSAEEGVNGLYNSFNKHKNTNPWMQTILSIGGPEIDNDLALRKLASKETPPFTTFSKNAVMFLREKNFDGLDVDWRYPPGAVQKLTFSQLLQALRNEFDQETSSKKLLLTATVNGIPYQFSQAYDVPTIAKHVDYVFVRAFDMIYNNTLATLSAPLFHRPNSSLHPALNVNCSIRMWNTMGMPYSKIVVGVSTVGPYVRLAVTGLNDPGAPVTTEVLTGSLYKIPSRLVYPEVCLKLKMKRFVSRYDYTQEGAYLIYIDQWIGHETFESLEAKVKFIKKLKTAGIFFSALDEDDFSGTLCDQGKYPVVSYIRTELRRYMTTTITTTITVTGKNSQTLSSTLWHRPRRTTVPYTPEDDNAHMPDYTFSIWVICLLIILFIVGCILGYLVTRIVRKKMTRRRRM